MPNLEERIRHELSRLAPPEPADVDAVLDHLGRRRRRRRVVRAAQTAALVVVVLAGSAAGVTALLHAFRPGPAAPSPVASSPPAPKRTAPPAVFPGFLPTAAAFWNRDDGLIGGGPAKGFRVPGCADCRGVVAVTHDGGRTWLIVDRLRAGVQELDVIPGTTDAWVLVGPADGAAKSLLGTTDGGATWTTLSGATSISGLSFPTPSDGWALAGGGLRPILSHSVDGGRTWRSVASPCPGPALTSAAVSFATPGTGLLVCAGEPGAGMQVKAVFLTRNGGASWHAQAETSMIPGIPGSRVAPPGGLGVGGYLNGVALLPDGHGWVWGDRSALLATSDFGRHWRALPLSLLNDAMGGPAAVALVSPPTGYVVTFNTNAQATQLLVTRDGGARWSLVQSWRLAP